MVLALGFRIVKMGSTGRLSGPSATISGQPPPIQVTIPIDNVTSLTGTAQFSLSVELEPRFDQILAAMATDAAADSGAATAGARVGARVGASIMTFEAFLTAGLVAGAAVTLWATYRSLQDSDAALQAGNAVGALTQGLTQAFIAGATSAQAPSNAAFRPGYEAGQRFLRSVAAGSGPSEPPMREDEAAAALRDLLPSRQTGIHNHMLPLARTGIWDNFARQQQGNTAALRTAYRAIFQENPPSTLG